MSDMGKPGTPAGEELRSDFASELGSLASDAGLRTPGMHSYGASSPFVSGLESHMNSAAGTPRTPGGRRRTNVNRGGPTRLFSTPRQTRQESAGEGEAQHAEGAGQEPRTDSPEGMDEDQGPRTVIWGTNLNIESVQKEFEDFFSLFKENETDEEPFYQTRMRVAMETQQGFILVDMHHLHTFNPRLYTSLIQFAPETVPIMDYAASLLYTTWFDAPDNSMMCRPFNLMKETSMRDLNPEDVNTLVSIKGMVIRTSGILPDMSEAFFKCSACEHVEITPVKTGTIVEPTQCPHCNKKYTMAIVHNRSVFTNRQIIRLQESPDMMPAGQTPHTVVMVCYDDQVEMVQPGDRLEVTGIFRSTTMRPNKNHRVIKAVMKTYLDVLHFQRHGKGKIARDATGSEADARSEALDDAQPDPEKEAAKIEKIKELSKDPDIYNRLVDALAPSIWGCEDIKRGLLCMLFGGVSASHSSSKMRGHINVLLCGDPGVSKSQFLSLIHKITSRGIYTSGKGSSSVGLTAYVTKDPETKELVLESGALVLSDGGICCIDEFDKMSEHTRSVLHEAMEHNTVSIAKAGIICTLNARASILAAANPRNSSYDTSMTIADNINLPPPLLSRFDLIYLVLDKVDTTEDERLARHIVSMYDDREDVERKTREIPLELLTDYISYARANVHPKISDEAVNGLIEGYIAMRQFGAIGGQKVISATTRQLESLIRVSEALARMRLSDRVEEGDVAEAVRLVRDAMQTASVNPVTGTIDMSIINTGQSETSRQKLLMVADAVKQYITEVQGYRHKLKDILEQLNQNVTGNMTVTLKELRQACASAALKDHVALVDQENSIQVLA